MGRLGIGVLSALLCAIAAAVGIYAIGLSFRCGAEYAGYVTLLSITVAGPASLFIGAFIGAIGYPARRTILIVEGALIIVAIAACLTMQAIPNFAKPDQMQCNYE